MRYKAAFSSRSECGVVEVKSESEMENEVAIRKAISVLEKQLQEEHNR